MGSQYIGDKTIRISNEQEIKKQRGYPNTVFGHLSVLYDGLLGINKRKWQVFHRILHMFHNRDGG